ncbi:MAG: adenylate/guanylate cyclase domain-containing protein [Saprospiraceae bacterium]
MYTKYFFLLFFCFSLSLSAQKRDIKVLLESAVSTENKSTGEVLVSWLRVYDYAQKIDSTYLTQACVAIGNLYSSEQLFQEALPYYLEASSYASNINSSAVDHTKLCQQLGIAYAETGNPDSTLHFYNKILTSEHCQGNDIKKINTLQQMVNVFSNIGNYKKTLELNLEINDLIIKQENNKDALLRNFNNLGYNYNQLEDYENAIHYFEKALELIASGDEAKIVLQTNIAIAYANLKNYKKSIRFLKRARRIQGLIDAERTGQIDHLMASIYLKQGDFTNALIYSKKSESGAKNKKNDLLLTDIYYTSARIHSEVFEYDEALNYYQEHLNLRDSFALLDRLKKQEILQQQIELERLEKQLKIFRINEEVQDLTISQLNTEKENQRLALSAQKAQLESTETARELLEKENNLKASQLKTKELESEQTRQALELAGQRLIAAQKEKEVSSLEKEKELQRLELVSSEAKLENELRAKELLERDKEILERNKAFSDLALSQQKQRTQFLFGLGALMTLLMILAGLAWINSRRLNTQLNKKNKDIEQQKEEITLARNKSDQLLLNILPEETANELKEKGFATPKSYSEATVMFTDFTNFTTIAAQMSPEELIKELNICFQAFDKILEEHGLEKIKTIGDAYMCVAGVPKPDKNHSVRAIQAGKEIVAFMQKRIRQKESAGIPYWDMRMGMHSGSVVAGVVGKKKFAYDVWGDTVNTASRMESNGEPGKINISGSTYELVKNHYNCISRGKIEAKNIGEIEMFFVE